MAPDRITFNHKIRSPNTNALLTLLNDVEHHDTKPTATGFQTVYVGNDNCPLIILTIAPIIGELWRKSASFEILASTMYGQLDVHDTPDLVSVISSELPIDVTSAFMEYGRIKKLVMSSLTNVTNLSSLDFLHSGDSTAKNLVLVDYGDRIANLAYIKL